MAAEARKKSNRRIGRTAAFWCQLRRTLGVSASGGEPPLPDFLKHSPKRWLRRHAHGSKRIQEGQPAKSPLFINALLTNTRAGLEPGPGGDRGKHVPKCRSHRARGSLISHVQPDVPAKIDLVGLAVGAGHRRALIPMSARRASAHQNVTYPGDRGRTTNAIFVSSFRDTGPEQPFGNTGGELGDSALR